MNHPDPGKNPVATLTADTPLRSGGISVRTRELRPIDARRMEFRATAAMQASCACFIALGLLALSGVLPARQPMVATGAGLAFVLGAAWVLYRLRTPIVFDRRQGAFWIGHAIPSRGAASPTGTHVRLEQIHALQLLGERCHGEEHRFTSYELNLVLEDGRRINVVDQGKLGALRADAETLAAFLAVPLWDLA